MPISDLAHSKGRRRMNSTGWRVGVHHVHFSTASRCTLPGTDVVACRRRPETITGDRGVVEATADGPRRRHTLIVVKIPKQLVCREVQSVTHYYTRLHEALTIRNTGRQGREERDRPFKGFNVFTLHDTWGRRQPGRSSKSLLGCSDCFSAYSRRGT